MTVAIIGASGFVGSRLRNRFLGQNTACILFDKNPNDSEEISFLDVTEPSSMNGLAGCTCIINLAENIVMMFFR